MKKLAITFLTILFCLTSSIAWSETLSPTDLVKRNGIHYKMFTNVPFTGSVKGKDKDGYFEKGTYKDGKKNNVFETYYENGQLESKGTFKDGKFDGVYEYYHENGQLCSKGTYKNSKEEGLWVFYHDNGELWYKGTYKNGKEEGLWEEYYDNGRLDRKGTYKDGKLNGISEHYYKNGKINNNYHGTYKNDVKTSD
tara:strand:- start:1017 stop:1601 length:585 start_codon:yes stop_codon:yes gene_type:complete